MKKQPSPVTMFVGMWIWTSVAPLQIGIENTTSITEEQLKTASTCSILGESAFHVDRKIAGPIQSNIYFIVLCVYFMHVLYNIYIIKAVCLPDF